MTNDELNKIEALAKECSGDNCDAALSVALALVAEVRRLRASNDKLRGLLGCIVESSWFSGPDGNTRTWDSAKYADAMQLAIESLKEGE